MSTQLKLRRGTTAQHSTFTGAEGEVTVDTTKDTLVVHDGVTAGGRPLPQTDASGNLGLGVTPSAWSTNFKMFEGAGASGIGLASANVNPVYLSSNWYNNGSNNLYKTTGTASLFEASGAGYKWYTAPSGTAGNAITFTQAMTLDASGNLGVGTSSPSSRLHVAATNAIVTAAGTTGWSGYSSTVAGIGSLFGTDDGVTFGYSTGSTVIRYAAGKVFGIQIGSTQVASFNSSGNLSLASGTFSAIGVYNNTTASAANLHVSSAGGLFFRSTSALKYKQDIRDLESMDIGLLRPVRYKSKCENDDQTKDHFGLIADEAVDAGFEELVTRGADNEVEGFQYERLTVVLLKELQTLRARVAALEAA